MNKAYANRVGTHLSWLRKQKKLTQEQLAARMQLLGCDITRSALAKIEVGQRMLCQYIFCVNPVSKLPTKP